jgi:translation initiation factor 2 subunit 2
MEKELPIIDFTKVKKKRTTNSRQPQTIVEDVDFSDIIITGKAKQQKEDSKEPEQKISQEEILRNDQEYSYDFLLERIQSLIKKNNPNMISSSKVSIPVPVIHKVGPSRSAWLNFSDVCNSLARPTDHLYQFILAELGVEGNLGGESQFLLKGRYNTKHIESLLKKYVHDYVQCANCKSSNTTLKRDNSARLQMLSCLACGSEKTVQPIKASVNKKK